MTEWKEPANGEETQFLVAIKQLPINKSTVEELKQVLRLVMIKVGLRAQNFPNDIEKAVLIEHIMNEYGRHTPLEVKLAFDMAIAGKLDLEEKEVVCYENFSCLYLSKIMNSYRRWSSTAYRELKKENPMIQNQPTELPAMEMIEWIEDWKKNPQINMLLIPISFYDFLTATDVLKVDTPLKREYFQKATISIKTELHEALLLCKTTDALKELAAFTKMEKEGFDENTKTKIANRAKKMIVYDYLKKK